MFEFWAKYTRFIWLHIPYCQFSLLTKIFLPLRLILSDVTQKPRGQDAPHIYSVDTKAVPEKGKWYDPLQHEKGWAIFWVAASGLETGVQGSKVSNWPYQARWEIFYITVKIEQCTPAQPHIEVSTMLKAWHSLWIMIILQDIHKMVHCGPSLLSSVEYFFVSSSKHRDN